MTIDAFRKALHDQPLTQRERDELTPHELFVQVLARRLGHLTDAKRRKLKPEDLQYLASAGLIPNEATRWEASSTTVTGTPPSAGIREARS
jgi:hypothetical protein